MFSIIIPLRPGEELAEPLLAALEHLPEQCELILASTAKPAAMPAQARFVKAPGNGRAAALNAGAAAAKRDWLWFLHADSSVNEEHFALLRTKAEANEVALHYFRLRFHDGGPQHWVNAIGANARSVLWGAPFGDQAFFLPRHVHEHVGGYAEDAPYGEDHLYARAVARAGLPLRMLPAVIGTSARRYQAEGWLSLTLKHQWLWIAQALQDTPRR